VKLPITVVLPTLNCRAKLDRHLSEAGEWLSEVAEIIAVDSGSTDGTRELLEDNFGNLSGAAVLSTEPGLYRAWNLATARAVQPFIYFSTIGDMIGSNGLSKLVAAAEEHSLELVVSVPQIVDEDGREVRGLRWPIHFLEDYLKGGEGLFLPSPAERAILSAIFVPETILGSSASNLYRTALLQKHPFPEDLGKQGDVYWAIRNLSACRLGLLPDRLASFCWDGDRRTSWSDLWAMMIAMTDDVDKQRRGDRGSELLHAVSRCVIQSKRRQYRLLFRFETTLRLLLRIRTLGFMLKIFSRSPGYRGLTRRRVKAAKMILDDDKT